MSMLRMLRSAVFIVPMNRRFAGSSKPLRVAEVDRLVSVLEEVHELAEHAREVRAVHLVDQKIASAPRIASDLLDDMRDDAVHAVELDRAVVDDGAKSFDELLVAIAWDGTGRCGCQLDRPV